MNNYTDKVNFNSKTGSSHVRKACQNCLKSTF
ncbi:putative translational regulatory protein ArgL [Pseudenterobacter timonensis]